MLSCCTVRYGTVLYCIVLLCFFYYCSALFFLLLYCSVLYCNPVIGVVIGVGFNDSLQKRVKPRVSNLLFLSLTFWVFDVSHHF